MAPKDEELTLVKGCTYSNSASFVQGRGPHGNGLSVKLRRPCTIAQRCCYGVSTAMVVRTAPSPPRTPHRVPSACSAVSALILEDCEHKAGHACEHGEQTHFGWLCGGCGVEGVGLVPLLRKG